MKAAIIDTTGSFPISLLAKAIKSRILQARKDPVLSQTTDNSASKHEQIANEDVQKEVQMYLEMVTISRVFDVEGLWEVIDEVTRDSPSQSHYRDGEEADVPQALDRTSSLVAKAVRDDEKSIITQEIVDSEDEGFTSDEDYNASAERPDEQEEEGIEILIIDSMTDMINELFARKEKSEGS